MTTAPLLTLDDVAAVLRVSRRTVERLVEAGRIRPVPIDGAICNFCREGAHR